VTLKPPEKPPAAAAVTVPPAPVPEPEPELSVSPTEMLLWEDGWRHKPSFVVSNASKQSKYDVYVRVDAIGTGASSQQIEFKPDEDPKAPKIMSGPIETSLDVIITDLADDAGKVFSLIAFYEIPPGARRRVELGATNGVKQRLSASVQLLTSSDKPAPIRERTNQGQWFVNVPVVAELRAVRAKVGHTGGEPGTLRMGIMKGPEPKKP
jgi:hypothetical protein